jgi:hypothetical protein
MYMGAKDHTEVRPEAEVAEVGEDIRLSESIQQNFEVFTDHSSNDMSRARSGMVLNRRIYLLVLLSYKSTGTHSQTGIARRRRNSRCSSPNCKLSTRN